MRDTAYSGNGRANEGCRRSRNNSGVPANAALLEAARAMASLGKSVEQGHRNQAFYRTDTALEPLRVRDDYRLLMLDLDFPAHPLAHTR